MLGRCVGFTIIVLSVLIVLGCARKHDYPPDAVTNYMNACMLTSLGDRATCSCTLEKIQYAYSYDDFKRLDADIRSSGKTPDKVSQAQRECASQRK
jgi:hypothetical protein